MALLSVRNFARLVPMVTQLRSARIQICIHNSFGRFKVRSLLKTNFIVRNRTVFLVGDKYDAILIRL